MVQFSSIFNGLTRSISIKNAKKDRNDIGREASNTLVKEAKKNDSVLSSPGTLGAERSANFASVFSKRGKKGINQDCFVVWKEFGCQEDMTFCGVFDGHGPWGHLVSKRVRKLMPPYLLCNWQEALALNSLDLKSEHTDRSLRQFDTWKQSYLKTFSAIDQDLEQHPVIDSFHSGSTALTMVRQGDLIVIANVGDSRAVLATVSDNGNLVPVQLTVDLKPNLPEEIERITQSKGRIFSSHDEPGVYRVWLPNGETPRGPGLAISRAFGDYYIKDFGLISEPEVTQIRITCRDQFAILATDWVWDVVSNEEAVGIVSSTPGREESAKRLVDHAACAWKRKRPGIAMDDISAICLFFHTSPPSQSVEPIKLP
ncbi:probable protein phosphatase 2C 34 [Actinidia eriantha]|uniref:probable protein phosphatase 2C 34 n=1 Tax=Actinidia eriantha TaxID=165200 RepID=UPI0025897B05|nr:probable protein phosphatase 2C 34 [Actinidia eriantha]